MLDLPRPPLLIRREAVPKDFLICRHAGQSVPPRGLFEQRAITLSSHLPFRSLVLPGQHVSPELQ